MKLTLRVILSALCAITLFGCQTEPIMIAGNDSATTISISLEPSRTALGEKVGETYPVYWSEGDKIVINGTLSDKAVINAQNRAEATFNVSGSLKYPYQITYPYTATTIGNTPTVIVPEEQHYAEGTFDATSVPMCGYATDECESIALKHLVGLLKFPLLCGNKSVVLDKIVITSNDGVKLSGEFEVNCSAGTMVACANNSNSVTYILPNNFTLPTDKESIFYISLPAGNTGNCTVEFIEKSGEKMTATLRNREIKAGIVVEFKSINYQKGVVTLEPMDSEEDFLTIFYPTIHGHVKDTNGNPIAGVAVSNGFEVVATDKNGYYSLDVTNDTWYIYISVPAEYEIPINEYGQPCFYKAYPSHTDQYDFTLTPLAGGKEDKFALFAIGDPQVRNTTQFNRLNTEAIPGIYKHCQEVKASGIPCYAITLGDIISNSDGSNTSALRDDMRDAFHAEKVGLPVFQTYGNHDCTYFGGGVTISADKRSSTFELKAQRAHEEIFGPVDYSFDRGDIHIVSMRNIIYQHNDKSGEYAEGFLPAQYEWLKQDLALVPKNKMVILCVHAPVFRCTGNYLEEAQALLNQFDEAHIISGHTHYSQNYEYIAENPNTPYPKLYEHNVGALCGVWWRGNIACDGAPCGYNVFMVDGNKFVESYFMGYNAGMDSKATQMRLHRGNAVTGRARTSSDTYAGTGYYAFNFGEDYLIANIYNADTKWVVKVYEDGVYSGNMEQVALKKPSASSMIGSYTLEDPRRVADGVVSCVDMYTAGLYYNYYEGRSAWSICYHLYKYKLKNKGAKIRVEATDRYGKTFVEENITEGTDYRLVTR